MSFMWLAAASCAAASVDELIDEWFEAVEVVGSIAHPNLLNLHVVCK